MLATLFAEESIPGHTFLETHSGEVTILFLTIAVLGALLILVPQLLRSHHQAVQLQHEERMKSLEQGLSPPLVDPRSTAAGRTAALVPMVVVCAAGTVTCFLAVYRSESLFSVSLAVWSVAGVVSLAAITGGVALMGRLAQLNSGVIEEEEDEVPEDALSK